VKTVGTYEAKTHLPKLPERVMKGERITITKHGIPVAVLQSPDDGIGENTKSIINELHEFRSKHRLKGLSLRELMEDGRR